MAIAENLKHWRQVRGLTQPELAEKAEIEQSYLSKLENGRSQASEGVRERLADALEIDVETLLQDPSRNGHLRRLLVGTLLGLMLVSAGFAGGYMASGYELRKVNHDGERLRSIWAMAPADVRIKGIEEFQIDNARRITGSYENKDTFQAFTSRLLDSGIMGSELIELRVSERSGDFAIYLRGPRAVPAEPASAQ